MADADPGPNRRVVIVEDHPMFREALASMLASAGVEVLASEESVSAALTLIANEEPDLVIMDLQMPDGSGIDATARIIESNPRVRVLVLTSSDDDASVDAALRVGAHGFLHKSATPDEILRAVETVCAGDAVFDAVALRRITDRFSVRVPIDHAPPFPELTVREREVLELVARGESNAQIAEALFLSVKTVRNQVSTIFSKLGVSDRPSAIVRAREQGLGTRRPGPG